MDIRPNFIHQLSAYETRLSASGIGPKTTKWTEVFEQTNEYENEELLLRNTYMNGQIGPMADLNVLCKASTKSKIIFPTSIATEMPDFPEVLPKRKHDKNKKPSTKSIMKCYLTAFESKTLSGIPNNTRNYKITKERSFSKDEIKPVSRTMDIIPSENKSLKLTESKPKVPLKPPTKPLENNFVSSKAPPPVYQVKAIQQPPTSNFKESDTMLKQGLSQIYGIKELHSFANITNTSITEHKISKLENPSHFQSIDCCKPQVTQKCDKTATPIVIKKPRSFSVQSVKEPVRTEIKTIDDMATKTQKVKSQQAIIKKNNVTKKYINQHPNENSIHPYFANQNAMSSFRTGPVKATNIEIDKKIERPASSKPKPPENANIRQHVPHNRPSSPGLKGKVVAPTYTAMNKAYMVTTYNKIRGMTTNSKSKGSINISSACGQTFVRPPSKQHLRT